MSPVPSINDYTVIVIGAGMAGLGACKTLIEGGVQNILLLEGQERAGGRVHSVPIGKSIDVRWLELGAQWLHGENSNLHSTAKSNGLLSDITSAEGLGQYLLENGEQVEPKIVAEISDVVGEILEDCEQFWTDNKDIPESVGSYLDTRFYQYLDNCNDSPKTRKIKLDLYQWHIRFQVIDNSCNDLNDLSAKSWGRYKFCGGTDYINFKAGYSSLIDCLVNELPPGLLKLNTPVHSVTYNYNNTIDSDRLNNYTTSPIQCPVVVTCENGIQYYCQHVIVTCSLGYLKKNHQTMFKPVLPPKLYKSIESMGYAVINKIFLCYEKPWWPKDQHGFQIIWSSDSDRPDKIQLQPDQEWMKDLTGFDVLPYMEGILLGWVGRIGAINVEQLAETEVGEHCTYLLRQFTKRYDIPLPKEVVRSSWHSNRFICGGYSHLTPKCDIRNPQNGFDENCKEHTDCIVDECSENVDASPENLSSPVFVKTQYSSKHPAVLVAGEATHPKYFSTTHGAFETGKYQANKVLNFIESNVKNAINGN